MISDAALFVDAPPPPLDLSSVTKRASSAKSRRWDFCYTTRFEVAARKRPFRTTSERGSVSSIEAAVVNGFIERFGEPPAIIVRAPGRVNIIGEHTDYNDGFVLPMAIDQAVWIALRPRADKQVSLYAVDMNEEGKFDLAELTPGKGWIEYVKGVAHILQG